MIKKSIGKSVNKMKDKIFIQISFTNTTYSCFVKDVKMKTFFTFFLAAHHCCFLLPCHCPLSSTEFTTLEIREATNNTNEILFPLCGVHILSSVMSPYFYGVIATITFQFLWWTPLMTGNTATVFLSCLSFSLRCENTKIVSSDSFLWFLFSFAWWFTKIGWIYWIHCCLEVESHLLMTKFMRIEKWKKWKEKGKRRWIRLRHLPKNFTFNNYWRIYW